MTDEKTFRFHQQLAGALDAQGFGEYAWNTARHCPQGHADPTPKGPHPRELCLQCVSQAERTPTISIERWQRLNADLNFHPEWRFGNTPKNLTDATTLLAAVQAWIAHRPEYRTMHTEWWCNTKRWVCKFSEFSDAHTVFGIGQHPTNKTIAEATAFLTILTGHGDYSTCVPELARFQ